MNGKPILIATRGSALALAQANMTLAACRQNFPQLEFDLKILKTTGDKLQTAAPAGGKSPLPKGLFTKELEAALLKGQADLAVHSLKDLPTDPPPGLCLGAVAGKREDVRDVLIYKKPLPPRTRLAELPSGLATATGSARRAAQLLACRPDFKILDIRGNVPTRLAKLAAQANMDATILAAAGLARLGYSILESGELARDGVGTGLLAVFLDIAEMLPCVGQGAIGLELRENDAEIASICRELNDAETLACVTAERSLLRALGGGCQTPLGAYARISGSLLHLQAISFESKEIRRAAGQGEISASVAIGQQVASQLCRIN